VRYHSNVDSTRRPEVEQLLEILEAGGEPEEGALTRVLRRPGCPGELVQKLSRCSWIMSSRTLLKLLVRHPRCPRHFAWDVLTRLGWNDLVEVARDPRTAPAVRPQCERKLIERLATMTLGERISLARVAPRGVIGSMIASEEPSCVAALLDNPFFTEVEALRLLVLNRSPNCLMVLLRHPGWGRRIEVVRAAVRTRTVPLGVALGLLPVLSRAELCGLASSPEVAVPLRTAAGRLASRRGVREGPPGGPTPS
jgi:hypothetical protein